jgi:hypothetical protein
MPVFDHFRPPVEGDLPWDSLHSARYSTRNVKKGAVPAPACTSGCVHNLHAQCNPSHWHGAGETTCAGREPLETC